MFTTLPAGRVGHYLIGIVGFVLYPYTMFNTSPTM